MHFNFDFTAVQILWTLTFASILVLLVVLLGRDRASRFPWFTASIILLALRLLMNRLLHDRLPQLTMAWESMIMADLSGLVGLLVVVEMARRAFAKVQRLTWLVWGLILLGLGGVVLWKWGAWPPLKAIAFDTAIAKLQFMQLLAMKTGLLSDVLKIALGVLVVAFGRRYGAGWHSHVQRIVIGLSTASLAQMGAEGIWQIIARTATPHSQAEYLRIIGLQEKLLNTNSVVYIVVVIWWIVCLWIDEPGAVTTTPVAVPIYAEAPEIEATPVDLPKEEQD